MKYLFIYIPEKILIKRFSLGWIMATSYCENLKAPEQFEVNWVAWNVKGWPYWDRVALKVTIQVYMRKEFPHIKYYINKIIK